MKDFNKMNEISRKLSEDFLAYIELKKDERIITKNSISEQERAVARVITRKSGEDFSEKDIDIEKTLFQELIEDYETSGLSKKENAKIVIHDAGLTPVVICPESLERITGIMVMYSYIYN